MKLHHILYLLCLLTLGISIRAGINGAHFASVIAVSFLSGVLLITAIAYHKDHCDEKRAELRRKLGVWR